MTLQDVLRRALIGQMILRVNGTTRPPSQIMELNVSGASEYGDVPPTVYLDVERKYPTGRTRKVTMRLEFDDEIVFGLPPNDEEPRC